MITKKQQRADRRIRRAKEEKEQNYQNFVYNRAKRRVKDPGDSLRIGFCCLPDGLGMSIDEFLSKGQKMFGGAVYLFDRGKLEELIPRWRCTNRGKPAIIFTNYIRQCYHKDGSWRDAAYLDPFATSGTSGSSNWR